MWLMNPLFVMADFFVQTMRLSGSDHSHDPHHSSSVGAELAPICHDMSAIFIQQWLQFWTNWTSVNQLYIHMFVCWFSPNVDG